MADCAMKPVSAGYADVNGIRLYHEVHGQGDPLVLIHGGLTTIGEMERWVRPLAEARQVVAVEMQGHGRTHPRISPIVVSPPWISTSGSPWPWTSW